MIILVLLSLSAFSGVNTNKASSPQIVAKISTMGLGLELNYPVNSVLSVGFGINKFKYSVNGTNGNVDANADLDLSSFSMIANYHPWGNGFRLRGGAYYNNNKINFKATSNAKLNNITYANANVNGIVSFTKFAPYIGIGYGSEPVGSNKFSFDFDLGVMKSSPSLALTGSCVGGTCGAFTSNLAAEKAKLQKDFDKYNFFPVISFGLSYRF